MALTIPIISEFGDKGIKRAIAEFKQLKTTGEKAQFAIKKAALPAVLALGALAGMAHKTLAAGEAAATANARIAQINESMGLFGEATNKVNNRLIEYANATARATGVDQNQIKLAQAKLLTFKELAESADEAGGAFDRATKAAIDMGAAGFGTAEMNAVQLGKALNDPIKGVTALAKSGVTFTEQEKDKIKTLVESNKLLEAQDLVLKAIETQVGGTAEATANDSDKMKVAFSQLSESIGIILLPVFKELTAVMMKVADFARKNSKVIVILSGVIAALAIGVIAVNAAMKVYQATLVIITAAQALFNFVMSANPIGLVIIAIAAIVAALVILEKKFGVVTIALRIVGDGFKNGIIDPVRAAIGLIADLVRAIGKIPGVGAIGGFIGGIDIPGFADGGIVTRPTLAMVGEKGPEAIIPLTGPNAGRGIGGGGGVTVNVNGGLSTSAEIGQAVVNAIRAYNRSAGPAQIQVA
jgi:hypothetical protein